MPTEAEWEFSCRAGTTTPFYLGGTISTDNVNYNGVCISVNGKTGVFRQGTTVVGSFPANAFGLLDMHGNVFEWCQDWSGNYLQNDVVDPKGPNEGKYRVIRGGSWIHFPGACRSAFRGKDGPTHSPQVGCRLCFSLD